MYQIILDLATEKNKNILSAQIDRKTNFLSFLNAENKEKGNAANKAKNQVLILTFSTVKYQKNGFPLSSIAFVALSQTWYKKYFSTKEFPNILYMAKCHGKDTKRQEDNIIK